MGALRWSEAESYIASGKPAGSDSSSARARRRAHARPPVGPGTAARRSPATAAGAATGACELHGDPAAVLVPCTQPSDVSGSCAPEQGLLLVGEGIGEDASAGVPARHDLVHPGHVQVGAGSVERLAQLRL